MPSVAILLAAGLFSSKKDTKIEDLEAEIDYLRKELTHVRSEYQDFRHQQSKMSKSQTEHETAEVIERILEVHDSLDLAKSAKNKLEFEKGLTQIIKQMDQALSSLGVEVLDPTNMPFDPELHEVLRKDRITTLPSETVVKVFTKGYVYKGKVLRPAKVAISVGGIARKRTGERAKVEWDTPPRRGQRPRGGRRDDEESFL